MPKPVYVSCTAIATLCGVSTAAVSNWLARGSDKIVAPDAYLKDGTPLWTVQTAKKISDRYTLMGSSRIAEIEAKFQ